jgi:hypothetical protein
MMIVATAPPRVTALCLQLDLLFNKFLSYLRIIILEP